MMKIKKKLKTYSEIPELQERRKQIFMENNVDRVCNNRLVKVIDERVVEIQNVIKTAKYDIMFLMIFFFDVPKRIRITAVVIAVAINVE